LGAAAAWTIRKVVDGMTEAAMEAEAGRLRSAAGRDAEAELAKSQLPVRSGVPGR
jgi:hypothetical protein